MNILTNRAHPSASVAGRIAAVLLLGVVAFQAALALGAPWGIATQGGANAGVLPDILRVGSVVTLIVYAALAAVAGTSIASATVRRRILTVAAAVMVFATVLNIASPSLIERLIWAPVTVALIIALWCAARHVSIRPRAHVVETNA
jgi:hypothetical protein